jgi:hypothetical protein
MLPEELLDLMRSNKRGVFKFINDTKDNYDAQIVLDAMSSRDSELNNLILGDFQKGTFEVESSGNEFLEIFSECLLYKTQKSITHLK